MNKNSKFNHCKTNVFLNITYSKSPNFSCCIINKKIYVNMDGDDFVCILSI